MSVQLDTQQHQIMVTRLQQWVAEHWGARIAADVVVGSRTNRVAEGPIAKIEEHPTRPGVYRVLFDSHLSPGATETGQDAVMFGWEVTDLTTPTPLTLEIAKGEAQRVVLTDLTLQAAFDKIPLQPAEPTVAAAPPVVAPVAEPPAKGPKRSTRMVLLGILAVLAVAYAAFVFLRDDTPIPPASEPTAPTAQFNAAERRLMAHVPWLGQCRPAKNLPAGAVASVVCTPEGEKTSIRYTRFASTAQVERVWERTRRTLNAPDSGTTNREYGTWCTIAIGECRITDGFYVVYRDDRGRATAQWTHDDLRILGFAQRNDGRMAPLKDVWQRSGPSE